MEFVRLTDADDPRLEAALRLYGESFPAHEQRGAASQREIMSHPDYRFTLVFEDETFLGEVLYWEAEGFLYVEHFCMMPQVRGRGYGRRALEKLGASADEAGRRVILEIDPPVDDIARRRKGFYERAGYRANGWTHVHPPYHEANEGHALVVMSYPAALSREEYEAFDGYLRRTVMAGACGAAR